MNSILENAGSELKRLRAAASKLPTAEQGAELAENVAAAPKKQLAQVKAHRLQQLRATRNPGAPVTTPPPAPASVAPRDRNGR